MLNTNNVGFNFSFNQQAFLTGSFEGGQAIASVQNSEFVGNGGAPVAVQNEPDPVPFDPSKSPEDQHPLYVDIDLGGGPYGSVGNNRFIGNGLKALNLVGAILRIDVTGYTGGVALLDANIIAKNNYWGDPVGPVAWELFGGPLPTDKKVIHINADAAFGLPERSTVEHDPILTTDPALVPKQAHNQWTNGRFTAVKLEA